MYARSLLSLVLAVQVLALASCGPANDSTRPPLSRGCNEERWNRNVRENAATRQNAESQQKMREEALADFGAAVNDVVVHSWNAVVHSCNAVLSVANAFSVFVSYVRKFW